MLLRVTRSFAVVCLLAGCAALALAAANDPFAGKWKLNQEKSHIAGEQLKIASLGENKYTITFGNTTDTLVADGTDQPVHFGRTEALTIEGPNNWKIVTKQEGHTISTEAWTLAPGGKTVNIEVTGTRPDGSSFSNQVTAKRIAGKSGFAGTWQSTSVKIGSPDEWEIEPYESDGLSFVTPAENDRIDMKFDGKDYQETGPNVAEGSTSSGRRVNPRTLEVTDKVKGEVMDTTQFKVSPDGKTLTLTVHEKGQKNPITIVYDKE